MKTVKTLHILASNSKQKNDGCVMQGKLGGKSIRRLFKEISLMDKHFKSIGG